MTDTAAASAWDAFPTATDYLVVKPADGAATASRSPWDAYPTADQYANQTIGPSNPLPPVNDDASKMAPISTQAAASLPTDEMAKVKYFATQRFPGLTVPQAVDRYFYKDNRLAYKGDDGKAYFEESDAPAPTSINNLSADAKALAAGVGPAIPVVTGGAAGALTMGFGGGVPGAIAGGAGGDAIRQGAANLITGEEKPWSDRALQATKAGLEQGAGQLIGLGATKMIPGRTPTFDIPAATQVGDAARKFNIPLTAGEETGDRTLLRRQKILANTTDADQTFEDFYRGRNTKVGDAVKGLFESLSPGTSPRVASGMGVEGAQAAVDTARADMQAQAKPYYDRALAKGNDIDPRLLGVQSEVPTATVPNPDGSGLVNSDAVYVDIPKHFDPRQPLTPIDATIIKGAQDAVRSDKVLGPTLSGWSDNSMYALDATKKHMDDMISAAKQEGQKYKASVLSQAREKLVTMMDQQYPEYANARQIYEEGMPAASNIENGITGDVAKLQNNDVLRASQTVFGKGSSPEDIRAARDAFHRAGDAGKLPDWQSNWNALVRSHLEQTFNEIPESSTGAVTNVGGTFYKAVYGNERKKALLEAATEHNPGLQADMLDLMTALNATGKAMKGESITAFAQMGQKELYDEGKGFLPKAIETVEIWRTPSRVANYLADIQAGKYNARMAELLTTPEGRSQLRELRKLGPGSAGSVVALSQLLTAGGVGAVSNRLNRNPDGPVSNPGYQAPETPGPTPGTPPGQAPPPSLLSDDPRQGR